MSNESKASSLLLGTVIGGAVGVLAALLLAPKSGEEMREDLAHKYQSMCSKTKEIASTVGDKAKDIVETVKAEASDLADQAKESNQRIAETIGTSTTDLKNKLESSDH